MMPEVPLPSSPLAPQFEDATQQREATTLGLWIFLATEVLFFGALFLGYTAYRLAYPVAFAEASRRTLAMLGGANTAVLLISSTTMAFAVRAAQEKRHTALVNLLCATALLGTVFLVIKGFEYGKEISEGLLPGGSFHFAGSDPVHARMFFYLYFLMTGVHALHVAIGIVLLATFAGRACWTGILTEHDTPVELLGLYWHFVDIVWVFLFPLIYLVNRHS
jgi:cytochrome c oxidase subunit 3